MKHSKTHYRVQNHIRIDRKHKVIRKYAITSAEVHNSQVFEELLDKTNNNGSVWADSAYRSAERKICFTRCKLPYSSQVDTETPSE
ncbi:transposase [Candidatus Vondammii sp. HM_W22]|uniref:transposase n=1 Tax=Candidatus Vondammii sp. HM_W22 TaxID=2687299 RepID=UPI001F12BE2E|nr:transposase [Candidatus Vondammii sp. HM_W22]